ncbi:MAG: transcriptional regulator, partial [Candidatus Hydrogenedentes bacterium]|nr:transcriptional regulator [Candidatus Hydrogenedentota bacterium]
GLVTSQKKGRWIYFALPEAKNEPLIVETLKWLFRSLEASEQYAADKKRLKQILKQDPVALCQRQNKPQT